MKKISKRKLQKKLLGGITPARFLIEYWQKKPLLIHGAIPGFKGLLSPEELAGLACEDDVQSRLVIQAKDEWQLECGAFEEKRFASLPKKNWALLVQGVNHYSEEAAELLRCFDFIPHARLDDLMVSFAPDGGGVGPHFDSYDVFLLQGQGQRLWRVSEQKDLTLIEGAPLRILQNFHTGHEYLLEPGDMLYLPPHVAHWGIAVGDCMTYSIGFRAPSAQELATEFLSFLQERCALEGVYADPDLKLQRHPAKIGADMLDQVAAMLGRIRWKRSDVAQFLGQYLSEPKPHVIFDRPRTLSGLAFEKRLEKKNICLDLKSQMLFFKQQFFMNGEGFDVPAESRAAMCQLADDRLLPAGSALDNSTMAKLHEWYKAGYIHFAD